MEPVTKLWKGSVLLADGAMGTLLFSRGAAASSCVELFNIADPALVEQAHRDYLAAGAQVITSNTFAANRLKLTPHGLRDRLAEINAAGVRLARHAAGGSAYVAGSVGPLGALIRPLGVVEHAEAKDVFAEHIAVVASGAPDILLLETFGSLAEALLAVAAAKVAAPMLPLLVSLSVMDDGRTPAGDALLPSFVRLLGAGADGVGINCAVGPHAVYDALAPIIGDLSCPVSVMPNAGYPHLQDDRTVYDSTPHYFARFAREFVALGATIVGGCCGTTPDHIAAMRPEVANKRVQPRVRRPAAVDDGRAAAVTAPWAASGQATARRPQTGFERKLGKSFVVTVEISPPRGVDYGASLAAAKMLEAAGVDGVDIGENPNARLRMSGSALAHLIMRETTLATILHMTCRDRNLLALQSELLGAGALGVTAVLALTGEPSNVGDFPKATSVFDVTSVGLTKIANALNHGKDLAGNDIGSATRFRIGAVVNPLASDLESELRRYREKVDAGADFAMTQPTFDVSTLQPFLERNEQLGIPLIVGVLPLRSHGDAEFLHNEVPGMTVPEAVRERLRKAKDEAAEGKSIATELLVELGSAPGVAGAYVVSRDNYELAAEVITNAFAARARA